MSEAEVEYQQCLDYEEEESPMKITTPETIKSHGPAYVDRAWEEYSIQELGNIVSFFVKRSRHRIESAKREKDLYDAQNYLEMIQAHLDAARAV